MQKKSIYILLAAVLIALSGLIIWRFQSHNNSKSSLIKGFDGEHAYSYLEYQLRLGARTPGSSAHADTIKFIQTELEKNGWSVEIQVTSAMDHPIQNIIARRGSGKPIRMLGAHYDSRLRADQDKDLQNRALPVPGANDGASGVAVLLELSRVLPKDIKGQVWLAFFDAEDQGEITGWDWILGSTRMADLLNPLPDEVVVIDMIGDANLNIYKVSNSNSQLTDQIWDQAKLLGYDQAFIPETKFSMVDDHLPFIKKGVPAADIIDFDYPYWHTTSDTQDKVSQQSLLIIGDTLLHWLISNPVVPK